jgi:hypothetical protein
MDLKRRTMTRSEAKAWCYALGLLAGMGGFWGGWRGLWAGVVIWVIALAVAP